MDEMLEITADDKDMERHSSSRLQVGTKLSRADLMHLALMASENRAAHALGRNFPGLPLVLRQPASVVAGGQPRLTQDPPGTTPKTSSPPACSPARPCGLELPC